MRVLVCGGRDLPEHAVWNWLEKFGHQDAAEAVGRDASITTLIHGNASGADRGAARWAESEDIRVIAYPGGKGTADMIRQAEAADVPILYPERAGFTVLA